MKRSNFYVLWCIVGLIISLIGIVFSNAAIPIKDIITFNFTLNMLNLKDIISRASIVTFVLCIFCLFFALGLAKRKNEEISQIKIYALHELLFLIN